MIYLKLWSSATPYWQRNRYQRNVTGDWWERVRKQPGKERWAVTPCVILDCFGGTMTVGQVCAKHGRRFVGLDLNLKYVRLGQVRLAHTQMVMSL